MPPKPSKRPREERSSESVEGAEAASITETSSESTPDEAPGREDLLLREGESLSGKKLREFLKKNFLDFADEHSARIEEMTSD
jgi:hypothetical protein